MRPAEPHGRFDAGHSLDDVVDGLADDLFDLLGVLLSHPLQPDAEGRLFGAAVVPAAHKNLQSDTEPLQWTQSLRKVSVRTRPQRKSPTRSLVR